MKLAEAARQVCALIQEDINRFRLQPRLDPDSPDGDPAKFMIDGKIVRITNSRDGFFEKISLAWSGVRLINRCISDSIEYFRIVFDCLNISIFLGTSLRGVTVPCFRISTG